MLGTMVSHEPASDESAAGGGTAAGVNRHGVPVAEGRRRAVI
jgi:hypothetical protein